MTALPAALSGRAIAYVATRDLIPLYAVYALLFSDHGLSSAAISSLFIIWSLTAFVAEIPSGAWADIVSRRLLLVLSSLLYAAAFALWLVAPTYAGFAGGFVLWGVSGALMSGTFEALLYDELLARGAARSYARIMGLANASAMLATVAATALAAPLLSMGGYALVGWVSVGVALVQGVLALSLPPAPRVAVVDDDPAVPPGRGLARRYVGTLKTGVAEAARNPTVARGVLISALLLGFLAYDEYFPLVAREQGAPTARVPLLLALVAAAQALGMAFAGRSAQARNRSLAWALAVAAVLLATGALTRAPLGFVAIAVGYGVANNAIIVAEARLQDAIRGPARATVMSASGLLSELFAVLLFAGFALGAPWLSISMMVALLSVPLLAVAWLVPRWLPPAQR